MFVSLNIPVYGSDKLFGHVSSLIVHAQTKKLRAILVKSKHQSDVERIVPLAHVIDSSRDHLRVGLTHHQFCKLAPLYTEQQLVNEFPDYRRTSEQMYWGAPRGVPTIQRRTAVKESNLERGELLLDANTHVYATNGEMGYVKRLLINGATGKVMQLCVGSGMLWWQTEMTVPGDKIRAIKFDGVYLTNSKQALRKLMSANIRPNWRVNRGYA